jgi:hypothetical protein
MRRLAAIACALAFAVQLGACGRITRDVRVAATDGPPNINGLWQEPSDIQQRDLFHGPGGSKLMPRDASFRLRRTRYKRLESRIRRAQRGWH